MKFIVDRRTWYRGHGSAGSALLRYDGTRCCIGFVGQQCGIPDYAMLDKRDVKATDKDSRFPKWMRITQGAFSQTSIGNAYEVNDESSMTDTEREARLKRIFSANGDEIEFVNYHPKGPRS